MSHQMSRPRRAFWAMVVMLCSLGVAVLLIESADAQDGCESFGITTPAETWSTWRDFPYLLARYSDGSSETFLDVSEGTLIVAPEGAFIQEFTKCDSPPSPSPTTPPSLTPTTSAIPTPTPGMTPTTPPISTPVVTATPTPSIGPEASLTPGPTPTPTPICCRPPITTETPTPQPSPTPSPEPSATPQATQEPTPKPSPASTATPGQPRTGLPATGNNTVPIVAAALALVGIGLALKGLSDE